MAAQDLVTLLACFADAGWKIIALPANLNGKDSLVMWLGHTVGFDPPLRNLRNEAAVRDSIFGGLDAYPSERLCFAWEGASGAKAAMPEAYDECVALLEDAARSLEIDRGPAGSKKMVILLASKLM